MDIINSIFNAIFDVMFFPFKNLDPIWAMIVISFVTGILMLMIFKATSDQDGIKRAKNHVKAHFLAIRLYRDDLSLMFETMKNIILSNLGYMKQSLRPMLFLFVPVAIVLIQLGVRYEFRPLAVGESTVLTVRLQKNATMDDLMKVEIELPDGLRQESPLVRIEQLHELSFRIKAEKMGKYDVGFRLGNQKVTKRVQVVEHLTKVTPEIASNFTTTLVYPGEKSLESSAFAAAISLTYPKRDFSLFGFSVHWLIAFFVISMIFGFGFKGVMGVEL